MNACRGRVRRRKRFLEMWFDHDSSRQVLVQHVAQLPVFPAINVEPPNTFHSWQPSAGRFYRASARPPTSTTTCLCRGSHATVINGSFIAAHPLALGSLLTADSGRWFGPLTTWPNPRQREERYRDPDTEPHTVPYVQATRHAGRRFQITIYRSIIDTEQRKRPPAP